MTKEEFLKANPDAEFIGFIKVGNRGCNEFYTDREAYVRRRDKVWGTGHDFEASILKGKPIKS